MSAPSPPLTEKEKMLRGELYHAFGPELSADRARAKEICQRYNATTAESERPPLLQQLLRTDEPLELYIEPPFWCDYGYNIRVGKDVYMNHNCVILDCNTVTIGDRVLFGPNVSVYAATHPLEAEVRQGTKGPELARPIKIGNDVWVGGSAVLLPGITIGDGAVVGAGAVVTRDVEPYTVVAGNPARLLRRIERPA